MMAEEESSPSLITHQQFHCNHGSLVQLSENRLSAFRLRPSHEFNQGLVFSSSPLRDDIVFEVKIDRKVHSWTGSLQIGVTTRDPSTLQPAPPNALDIVNKSWVLSGCNLFENGKIVVEDYGPDLDELNEGDRVGVSRTGEGDLVFYINSFAQGVAASGIPSPVYAVVDLYGKCVQTTVVNNRPDMANCPTRPLLTLNSSTAAMLPTVDSNQEEECVASSCVSTPGSISVSAIDRLRFHHRCGTMVKLSSGQRTGERRRPLDEFNNGVIMTQRPLLPDELFEIRIDNLVDKWSGSIEVGITTHDPQALDFPSTMTNLRSGTIMMSGCGILTNGKGTRREYGQCNLDELSEGDRIGLIRKATGDLHFYVNGRDQGIAASNVPQPVWGVVDLYGRTVKVSLIDREDSVRPPSVAVESHDEEATKSSPPTMTDQLQFHPRCGLHAAVVNGGTTAHRPNAQSDFNHGVVLTNRPLRPNELFEVALDRIVLKWAGSIEIGVTTQRPEELDFPATMTNVRSGTWMMTGNGVMHNGLTVLDDYGTSLDRLGTGDRVGVVRRSNGVLHFFVNGEDQGPAAGHVPEQVYGVVDLYGQAAQISIVDHSPVTPPTESSPSPYASYMYPPPTTLAPLVSPTSLADSTYALPSSAASSPSTTTLTHTDLSFHHLHGRNTVLTNNSLTAARPNALSEFNDAICATSRPLKPGEMFEVSIEKLVERWSGSLELGVTAVRPEALDFPSTLTDIDYETWMLSGSSVMQDGTITRNGYPLDLDALQEGNRVGLLRHADGSLHYYLDGQDQGAACWNVPSEVYGVIDLYGQCAQVSLVHRPLQPAGLPQPPDGQLATPFDTASELASAAATSGHHPCSHRLSSHCGRSVILADGGRTARRDDKEFEHGLVFSASPLQPDDTFEICIEAVTQRWAGSISVGLTTFKPHDGNHNSIPARLDQLDSAWYLSGSNVIRHQKRVACCPSMERLSVGDVICVRRTADSTLRFLVNDQDLGVAFRNVPPTAYVVVDLHGAIQAVSVKSHGRMGSLSESVATLPVVASTLNAEAASALPLSLSQLALREAMQGIQSALSSRFGAVFSYQPRFHDNHGRNVAVRNNGQTAQRTASYNQGLLYSKEPLTPGAPFQVKIEKLDERWSGSLMIGVTDCSPDKMSSTPTSALLLKRPSWIVTGHTVHQAGRRLRSDLPFDLGQLQLGQTAGVYLNSAGYMGVMIDGQDRGLVAYVGGPEQICVYGVVDLYGACSQVSLTPRSAHSSASTPMAPQPMPAEEKALTESSKSEKTVKMGSANRPCRYKSSCLRFIRLMGLPDVYLELENSFCGCQQCFDSSAVTDKASSELKGWCRWRVKARRQQTEKKDAIDMSGCNEKWQTAFHGTRPAVVRRILDEGQLLPPDLGVWQQSRTICRAGKGHDGESVAQFLFSPSLQPSNVPLTDLYDAVLKRYQKGRVALQVQIQPGSYKVRRAASPLNGSQAQSLGTTTSSSVSSISPDAPQQQQLLGQSAATLTVAEESIYWYTKERGAAIVQALLVRTEDATSSE